VKRVLELTEMLGHFNAKDTLEAALADLRRNGAA
jgi:hypothetical protein